jgi:predicted nucleic acid-binding protein
MTHVVLDTSVVVAAARSRHGASWLLLEWLDADKFGIAISYKLILEYEKSLRREVRNDGWSDPDVTDFVDYMCAKGSAFEPILPASTSPE